MPFGTISYLNNGTAGTNPIPYPLSNGELTPSPSPKGGREY
jgi:hypothetical protein